VNNLPKVVTQQRRGRASNPRLLDRKSDALPLFSSLDVNIILKDRGRNGIATASVDLHGNHAYNSVKL